jgi:hypothetical protein
MIDRKRLRQRASRLPKQVRDEIEQDLAAYDAYVEKYGAPAEMLREYFAERDEQQ